MLARIERLNKHVASLQGLLEDAISERCSLLKDFRDTMLTGILRNVDTYDEFHRNTFTGVQALLTFYRLYKDGAFGEQLPVPVDELEHLLGISSSTFTHIEELLRETPPPSSIPVEDVSVHASGVPGPPTVPSSATLDVLSSRPPCQSFVFLSILYLLSCFV